MVTQSREPRSTWTEGQMERKAIPEGSHSDEGWFEKGSLQEVSRLLNQRSIPIRELQVVIPSP